MTTYKKEKNYKKCSTCGKTIYRYPRDQRRAKNFYCSKECRKRQATLVCKYCGKAVTRPPNELKDHKYCSFKCSCLDNIKIYKLTCLNCKKQFEVHDINAINRGRKFCSHACYAKFIFLDTGQRNHRQMNDWVEAVKKRDGYRCQDCGSGTKLEVHHLLPYSLFKDERMNEKNGQTLCQKCHHNLHKVINPMFMAEWKAKRHERLL